MNQRVLNELEEDEGSNFLALNDLMFDQWSKLSGLELTRLGEDLAAQIVDVLTENHGGRKPRAELVDGVRSITFSIIANLVVLHRDRPAGSRLVMPLRHNRKTRYDRPGFNQLRNVLHTMTALGFVEEHPAIFREKRTTIEAVGDFKRRLLAPDVSLSDITRAEGEETIHLTARPKVARRGGTKQPNVPIDYKDTEESIRLRAEMAEINIFLTNHPITLNGSPRPTFRLIRRFTLRSPDDPHAFNLHGRLYGGFWMTLKASERSRLRIDGEPIADLDFSSMFPRLAYHHTGEQPPEGDLYAVSGLEAHREAAKAGLSALLSYQHEMNSLPSQLKESLPEGWTAKRLKDAYATHHPDLVSLFGKDFGLDLMFTESRILLAALRRLMADGVPALPMHDGMMVPVSKAETARKAMEEASEEILGVCLPVTRKC